MRRTVTSLRISAFSPSLIPSLILLHWPVDVQLPVGRWSRVGNSPGTKQKVESRNYEIPNTFLRPAPAFNRLRRAEQFFQGAQGSGHGEQTHQGRVLRLECAHVLRELAGRGQHEHVGNHQPMKRALAD